MLDAELTTHLHEVKNLEMKLREEQVRTQTMTHSNGHALRAVQDQLEAKVKLCSDLESKLSGCYEEVNSCCIGLLFYCLVNVSADIALANHCSEGV